MSREPLPGVPVAWLEATTLREDLVTDPPRRLPFTAAHGTHPQFRRVARAHVLHQSKSYNGRRTLQRSSPPREPQSLTLLRKLTACAGVSKACLFNPDQSGRSTSNELSCHSDMAVDYSQHHAKKELTRSCSRDLPHSMQARPDLTFVSAPLN
jgi:hypothetical protein